MEHTILTDFPGYSITESGIIRNLKTNKILTGTKCVDLYIAVKLYNKSGERI